MLSCFLSPPRLAKKRREFSKLNQSFLLIRSIFLFSIFIFSGPQINAQNKLSGIVKGTKNRVLSGATVSVKGTNIATVTAEDGTFSILAKPADILEVSFVGYMTAEVKVATATSLSIILKESAVDLDEVVVTGYVAQKVKAITGAVAIVKRKELTAIPGGQLEQMLQGRVAGLTVITSGQPGSPANIRLHGIGNFGDVTPLYIIDGVQGNPNNLNPNDIESIQVLKDAGAYSIYGVRGANGVVVITTRNGRPGKAKVTYDFYMSTTRPLNYGNDLLNPQEQADLTWIALKNSGNPNPSHPLYGNGILPVLPDFFIAGINRGLSANDPLADPSLYNIDFNANPIYQIVAANKTGTDWFHEVFKPAFSHSHSLSVSGANDKNKYFLSFGYLDQQGTALYTYLKRFTVRINTQFSVNDKIRIGENLQLAYRDNPLISFDFNIPAANDIFKSVLAYKILPVYDIKGGWAHFLPRTFLENPVASRTIAKDDITRHWEVAGNVFAEIDLLNNFTARATFGGNLINYYFNKFILFGYDSLGTGLADNSLTESSGYRRSWTWTNTLKYSQSFDDDHHLNALAGMEAIDTYNRELGANKVGFFTNEINYRFLTNGGQRGQTSYSFAGASTLYSIISQADYNYKEKYFFRGTLRRDGSSVFGERSRYGWFPSVSAAWRITEENFLEKVEWLNELKLRASWGKTGYYGNTDPLNQYTLYGSSIGETYYDIYGTNSPVQGFRAVRVGDPNTGWQEDVVTNIGFESVLWNNKLAVTLDWYSKKAKGLLFPATLPDILGGATPPNTNLGIIKNTGVDLLVGSKGRLSTGCLWDAAITLTVYKNRVLKISYLPYYIPSTATDLGKYFVKNEVGHPVGSFFGYKIIGIFKDDNEVANAPVQDAKAPGRFRYMDTDKNDSIDARDRIHFGNPNPDFTLGFNIGFTFKTFDLSAFFYGSFGNQVLNIVKTKTDFFANESTTKSKGLLYNSWTPTNTTARIPVAENEYNFSNIATENDYAIENGSYFRSKSLMLGYTLPKELLQKMNMENLRVYIQAVNLFTITKYTGPDPELSGTSAAFGIDFGNYPNNQKQFVFGINLNL